MFNSIEIITIKQPEEFKFKEKGSQFIGLAYPITSKDEAEQILIDVRKKYYDATHHCFCYKLLQSDSRYSDDGEPNGTAGIRILNAIEHFDLTNLLTVVVRYYGGTKLGVGPLGKAYYQGAFGVLDICQKVKKSAYLKLIVKYSFNLTSPVHHLLSKHGAEIINNLFEETPAIEFFIKPDKYENIRDDLIEQTGGKVELELIEENIIR